MLDKWCDKCKETNDEDVKKFKVEFFYDGCKREEEIKEVLTKCNSIFCLVSNCDENLSKMIELSKGIKV